VQIGRDNLITGQSDSNEARARERLCAGELDRLRPGSRFTHVLLTDTDDPEAKPSEGKDLAFVPLQASGGGGLKLWSLLSKLHKARPIDVLTPQSPFEEARLALLFGRFRKVPVVGQIHFDFFSPMAQQDLLGGERRARGRMKLAMRLLRKFRAVRTASGSTRQQILDLSLHNNVHAIPTLPLLTEAAFKAQPAASPQPGERRSQRVLFIGGLTPQKNLETWLQVATRLSALVPTIEFDLVGEGPLRQELEAFAVGQGIGRRTRFHGDLHPSRWPDLYRQASLFLLTSHYEGLSREVMLACLHQVPVVSTRIAGVSDIVADGRSGFLHAEGDVESLARSAAKLLSDAGLRQKMGLSARNRLRERFNAPALAEQWMSLLIASVKKGPG
jgi:glycosyltransferase involved in cell wall biosynthesis